MNHPNVSPQPGVKTEGNWNFTILMLGRIVSETASQMLKFALSLYVLDVTGSAVAFSMIFGFSTFAAVIVNLFAGFISDRYDRKKIMVVTDLISALIVLAFLPIFNVAPGNMVNLTIYAIVIGALQALFELTITAIIPDVFKDEDIGKANSALQSIYSLIAIFGVIIGAIAYRNLSMNMIFLIDAISFVLSGILALFLKPIIDKKDYRQDVQVNYLTIITEVFSYLKSKADIRFFLVFTMLITFVFASMVILVLPYIGYKLIKVSAFQLSLLQAAWSVGTITGAVYVATRQAPQKLIHRYFFFLWIQSVLLIFWVFPLGINTATFDKWPVCAGYFILVLLLGVFNSLQTIPIITYFQNSVPEQMRARFFGIFHTVILVACPLGMFVYGALLAKVFWAYLPLISGCCMLAVCILSQKSKTFVRFLNSTEKEEGEWQGKSICNHLSKRVEAIGPKEYVERKIH